MADGFSFHAVHATQLKPRPLEAAAAAGIEGVEEAAAVEALLAAAAFGLGDSHALHLRADAGLSIVHMPHAHCEPAAAANVGAAAVVDEEVNELDGVRLAAEEVEMRAFSAATFFSRSASALPEAAFVRFTSLL